MTPEEMDMETMLILIGARDVGLVRGADSWGFAIASTFNPDFSSEDVDFLITSGLLRITDAAHAVPSPAGLELLNELERVNQVEFSMLPEDEALN
jgi:hypothetical protein